eukprot:Amastigsp_a676365_1425.p2 type:complete len:273 gc:universal Amastigsp_a676365_1425:611-1429(+)
MRGVRRDVAALVVRVDGEVETHQLVERGVVRPEHRGKVRRPVVLLREVNVLAAVVDVAVDARRNGRQLGDEVHRVLVGRVPVLRLVDPVRVRFGKERLLLEQRHRRHKLRHRVQRLGERVDDLERVLGDRPALVPLVRDRLDLSVSGDLARHEQPEEPLGQRLHAALDLRELLLALGDREPAEPNALVRVEQRGLGHEALDPAHAAVGHGHGHIAQNLLAVLGLHILDLSLLDRNQLRHALLERHHRTRLGRNGGATGRCRRGANRSTECHE